MSEYNGIVVKGNKMVRKTDFASCSVRKRGVNRGGFTFIEVLTVVIIIGLLAAFVVPRVFKNIGFAKTKIARSKMAIIENALAAFNLDCGRYPTSEEGLDALLAPPAGLEDKWNGRYLKKSDLLDPWGNPYIYVAEGTVNPGSYDLISLGADGQEGGTGDNADIYND